MRLLIVDDHRLFAEAIRPALVEEGADVLPIAENGSQALEMARAHRPNVVLMDIGLPDRSGLHVGREILEEFPETRVIALTALDDTRLSEEATRVGFRGYVTKGTNLKQFVQALRAIIEGNVVLPHRPRQRSTRSFPENALDHLTAREREVLSLLARGATSQTIAATLGIARNTVRTHVQNILVKLQVHSRLEAAAFAVRHGLVDVRGAAQDAV